jgi:hypothetical protein
MESGFDGADGLLFLARSCRNLGIFDLLSLSQKQLVNFQIALE